MPVRLVAVKNSPEVPWIFSKALRKVAEFVQRAEAQDVLPGPVRQPTTCWVIHLQGRHPSRQQVAPLTLPQSITIDVIKCTYIGLFTRRSRKKD